MTGRTGCGVAIPHPTGSKGLTQCGLEYGKPWVKPVLVALCPNCHANIELATNLDYAMHG